MGASGKGGVGPVVAADRGPAADQRHPEESSEHAAYFRTAGSFFLQLPPSLGTISWFHAGFLSRVTCSNRQTILTRPPRRLPRTSGLHRAPTSLAELCSVLPLGHLCLSCFPPGIFDTCGPHILTFPLQPIPRGLGTQYRTHHSSEPLAKSLQAPDPMAASPSALYWAPL